MKLKQKKEPKSFRRKSRSNDVESIKQNFLFGLVVL